MNGPAVSGSPAEAIETIGRVHFFGSAVHADRSLPDLKNDNHTFGNERLARYYRIANFYGSRFRSLQVA